MEWHQAIGSKISPFICAPIKRPKWVRIARPRGILRFIPLLFCVMTAACQANKLDNHDQPKEARVAAAKIKAVQKDQKLICLKDNKRSAPILAAFVHEGWRSGDLDSRKCRYYIQDNNSYKELGHLDYRDIKTFNTKNCVFDVGFYSLGGNTLISSMRAFWIDKHVGAPNDCSTRAYAFLNGDVAALNHDWQWEDASDRSVKEFGRLVDEGGKK